MRKIDFYRNGNDVILYEVMNPYFELIKNEAIDFVIKNYVKI